MATKEYKIQTKVGIYDKIKSGKKIGNYNKGKKVDVTKTDVDGDGNSWGKTKKGWFMLYNRRTMQTIALAIDGKTKKEVKKLENKANRQYEKWKTTSIKWDKLKFIGDNYSMEEHGSIKNTMQLFGIPYQFLESVDCRVNQISTVLGRKFIENFILNAPVVTFMPGKPTYLPDKKDKVGMTQAFLQASTGSLGSLKQLASDGELDNLRLYDFQTAYTEYFRYVNILCRTCATFLEINENEDDEYYKINNEYPDFLNYDWRNYRWNGSEYHSAVANATSAAVSSSRKKLSSILDGVTSFGSQAFQWLSGSDELDDTGSQEIEEKSKKDKAYDSDISLDDDSYYIDSDQESIVEILGRQEHYIQFYCNPTGTNYSRSLSNSTQDSQLKSAMDTGTSAVREIQFMANTGGVDDAPLKEAGEKMLQGLGDALGGIAGAVNSQAGTLVERLSGFAANVINGENLIMPQIYSGTSQGNSISVQIDLKCVYGNKYSYYMDYLVPLMHLIALAYPKATTANTYSSPFLIKAFMKGVFTCNLGIISDISIAPVDSYNDDGLYMGATVTLSITDLYPDLSMTPSNHPFLFVANSSLIEYLATSCGLNLLENQFSTKVSLVLNNVLNVPGDTIDSVKSNVTEKMDSIVQSYMRLM